MAGYISITTFVDVDFVRDNNASINVTIKNSGTDEARNVKVSLISDQFKMSIEDIGTIYPNSEKSLRSTVFVENIKKGSYIAAVKVEYSDQSGKTFSAITPVTIVYKEPSLSRVIIDIEKIKIEEQSSSSAKVKIKNNDFYEKNINVKIFLPMEFSVYPLEINENIQPGKETTKKFLIRNMEGIDGSEYAIFAAVNYDDENYHYSQYKISTLEVVSKKAINLPILMAIFLLLLTLTISYLSKKKKK